MPDPRNPPAWPAQELMKRWNEYVTQRLPRTDPEVEESDSLAKLGLDGSRFRRRYWKKVTER